MGLLLRPAHPEDRGGAGIWEVENGGVPRPPSQVPGAGGAGGDGPRSRPEAAACGGLDRGLGDGGDGPRGRPEAATCGGLDVSFPHSDGRTFMRENGFAGNAH